jgi:hypothetical protein
MQPEKGNFSANFSASAANAMDPLSASQRQFRDLIADAQADQHPALGDLRRILDRPDLHTIGDLAVLTDRLTSEMMLFNALVGGPLAQLDPQIGTVPPLAAPGTCPTASDAQAELLAEFLRDLEG